MLRKFALLIGIISALPFRLILLILSPIVLIRFAFVDAPRMGSLILDAELYLIENKDKFKKKSFDFFIFEKPICNNYLKSMWSRFLLILPEIWFLKMLKRSYQLFPFGHKNILKAQNFWNVNNFKILLNTKSHLNFNEKEIHRGNDLIEKLGIKPGSRWICFHNRDQKYLEDLKKNKEYDFKGNFEYHKFRNFSIQTMLKAAEELTKKGYYIVRVGSSQKEKMESENPMIIDYSLSKFRSDFGDIFIGGNCDAYIGSDSGTYLLPFVFRKPTFLVNHLLTTLDEFVTRSYVPYPFIPKHIFDLKKKRNLILR